MSRHEELARLFFVQRGHEADLIEQCVTAARRISRAIAELLGSPPDGLRNCRILKPEFSGLPPKIGEHLGDVRRFEPPLPVYDPRDDFYYFALEWFLESPVKSQGFVWYAVKFGIDMVDGEFTLKHGNGTAKKFANTDDGVMHAAEFVIAELEEEFSRQVVSPSRRIGFVSS